MVYQQGMYSGGHGYLVDCAVYANRCSFTLMLLCEACFDLF
jgi:hypothetical protein